jgi:hypothetical protein
LTTSGERALAAAMLAAALQCQAVTAYQMVEIVDAVSAAVLRTAGADDPTARDVLSKLWAGEWPWLRRRL